MHAYQARKLAALPAGRHGPSAARMARLYGRKKGLVSSSSPRRLGTVALPCKMTTLALIASAESIKYCGLQHCATRRILHAYQPTGGPDFGSPGLVSIATSTTNSTHTGQCPRACSVTATLSPYTLPRLQSSPYADLQVPKHSRVRQAHTCARSSSMCAARCASAVFPWSIFFANFAFDCVYSCPQNTQVLAGSSRSFARDCGYAVSK